MARWGIFSQPEFLAQLKAEYEAGTSAKALAEKYGISLVYVYKGLHAAKAKLHVPQRKHAPPGSRDKARKYKTPIE